ncbi:hypothetical protein Acr_22g0001990 [Actinidia rufa]|uniref:DRBM domain-containing protein n=1 Tax=Actinidia rufa TaxID=165716 RepID=A0A7J0GJ84_9ERIC|nr:hypothetical protein Acr_22g0001990 [Actinidia rufa]
MSDSMQKSGVPDFKDEKVDTGNKTCTDISSVQDELPIGDCALGPIQLGSKYLEKLHTILSTKENALSQTALRVLLRKRNKLSCQLRNLEDEIAVCDKNIQTILDGGEDNLAVKIEAIIDADNDELDDMCYENNWTLPTYRVSPVDGGFRANITVKGLDFECSEGSGLHSNPRLARESAAAQTIAKLRSMRGKIQ